MGRLLPQYAKATGQNPSDVKLSFAAYFAVPYLGLEVPSPRVQHARQAESGEFSAALIGPDGTPAIQIESSILIESDISCMMFPWRKHTICEIQRW